VSEILWYSGGLKFTCTGCGNCCTGAPGYVWLGEAEALRLAEHLALPFDEFARRYLRFAKGRISLIEKRNGDCVFWSATSGCEVYDSRPDQCRSWPFWHSNLELASDWEDIAQTCPGCNQGKHHDLVEIQNNLKLAPDRADWPD